MYFYFLECITYLKKIFSKSDDHFTGSVILHEISNKSLIWKKLLNQIFSLESFQKHYDYIDKAIKEKVYKPFFIFNLQF